MFVIVWVVYYYRIITNVSYCWAVHLYWKITSVSNCMDCVSDREDKQC